MLTDKQLQLFGLFTPFVERSFSDLKRLSGEKSHNALQQAIARFQEENLVKERQIGATKLLGFNLENPAAYTYLDLYARSVFGKRVRDTDLVQEQIEQHTPFYALVVFGSHAIGKQTEKSDLDVAIIIPDESRKHDVQAAVRSAGNKTLISLDVQVLTEKEFLEMLAADYENVGKEIARKHVAVHNSSIFYKLLILAQRHGWSNEAVPGAR